MCGGDYGDCRVWSNVAVCWFFPCNATVQNLNVFASENSVIQLRLKQHPVDSTRYDSNDDERDSTLTRLISLIFTADSTLTQLI